MEYVNTLLSGHINKNLVNRLLKYYCELKQRFSLGQYEPSQLNCAKFAEVVMRILEDITKRNYTPFNTDIKLDNLSKELEQLPKDKFADSLRIHIPRILRAIYDIRSKRGVAHVKDINPNFMDSIFVVTACDWILAELIRLFSKEDPNKVQKIIESIAARKVPIVEEFGEQLKVLNPNLSVKDKVLLILYYKCPDYVSVQNLKNWIKTKTSTHVTTVLNQLEGEDKIHKHNDEIKITKLGIVYVEKKIPKEMNTF